MPGPAASTPGPGLPAAYLAVVDGLPDTALLYDLGGALVHANPAGRAAVAAFGAATAGGDLNATALVASVVAEDRAALLDALEAAGAGRPVASQRLSFVVPGRRASLTAACVLNPLTLDGVAYVQVLARDVSARASAERAVARSEAQFRAVFDHSPVGVAVVVRRRFRVVNPALCRLLGRTPEELVGMAPDEVTHPDDRALSIEVVTALERGEVPHVYQRFVRPDGSVVWGELTAVRVEVAGSSHTILHLRDVTGEREASENLHHMAMHDPLTGLGNRLLLQDRLDHALSRREEQRQAVALLFLDLDGFKRTNDALGHAVGDKVLRAAARRISASVRPADTVVRWGGDEFVVLLEGLDGTDEAMQVVHRIETAVARPVPHRSDELFVTASVGVAFAAPGDGTGAKELLQGADAAMYRAKQAGRNRHSVFDQALRDVAVRRTRVEAVLRSAVTEDRVVLHYQPILDLRTRRPVGVEALLRLRDDDGAVLLPEDFLDVGEDSGLMPAVEHVVLRRALAQSARWRAAGHDLSVSVNVCAAQIGRIEDLEEHVTDALDEHDVPGDRLVCEVTEHALVDTTERTVAGMQRLRRHGVAFAVDDFGTGYSSMTYLQALPVSEVKIDRRFVVKAGTDRRAAAIVRAVAGMAAELDMRCVAEGIEDEATHELARRLGADHGQGYLYARPVPAEQLTAALDAGRW